MAASISLNTGTMQQLAAAPGAGGVAVERKALNQMEVQGINDVNLIQTAGLGGNVNAVA